MALTNPPLLKQHHELAHLAPEGCLDTSAQARAAAPLRVRGPGCLETATQQSRSAAASSGVAGGVVGPHFSGSRRSRRPRPR